MSIKDRFYTILEEMRLNEGNPLARMNDLEGQGKHFIAISTKRPGLSKKEVAARNAQLVAHARSEGYGLRQAEGQYEGQKEPSFVIHAKEGGREAGAKLVEFGKRMGELFDQDSILHHNGKTARLIGTNNAEWPGKGKSVKVGERLKYNETSPFQTELRPGKKSAPARFTTE